MTRFSLILGLMLFSFLGVAQKYTISGYVEDLSTGERLIGATVYDAKNQKFGTFTNEYGYFSLTLPAGVYFIRVSYVGYEPLDTVINIDRNLSVVFRLKQANVLEEVVVTRQYDEVQSTQTGRIRLPVQQIKSLPVAFGEQDVMKILQLLPGIQSGTEGTGGIFVRGGSADQNLVLLDGVPVYNLNHLGGFFSVFSAEAVKDVTVYKSGFPARYGGRLSSVIDVRMKDGNLKNWQADLAIGLISTKLTLQGPLKKDKIAFIITARRTYYDILIKPFSNKMQREITSNDYYLKEKFTPGYFFYDIYSKLNFQISQKSKILISFYTGKDKAYLNLEHYTKEFSDPEKEELFTADNSIHWQNQILAIRWNYNFAPKTFSNLILTYSSFDFGTGVNFSRTERKFYQNPLVEENSLNLSYQLGITDFALNWNLYFNPNPKNYIKTGLSIINHYFNPGQIQISFTANDLNADTAYKNQIINALESAIYFEDEFKLFELLTLNLGLRATSFSVRNKNFYSLEPRISSNLLISKQISLKFSYTKMNQYLHFLTNNTIGMPMDLWLPATDKVIPENSWQVSSGIYAKFKKGISFSIETFYKQMQNLIETKEGQTVFSLSMEGLEGNWEDKVAQGSGWAYGTELFLRKDIGKLQGWIAYTLAWAYRQFDQINNAEPFPFRYDRRHDLSLALTYKFKKLNTFSLVWVYYSGMPITVAKGEYLPFGYPDKDCYTYSINQTTIEDCYFQGIQYYGGRNAFRLPDYHRLDISLNLVKNFRKYKRTITLGVYNLYNRVNPFYTELVKVPDNGQLKTVLRIYSLFPVMPFASIKFEFK